MTIFGSRMLTGGILAIIGLITVKVLTALFGAIWAFLAFFLFTVIPIALVCWLVYKLLKSLTKEKTTTTAYE
jgi:uncharacterized membrane protein